MSFMEVGDVDEDGFFNQSFGKMGNRITYHDPQMGPMGIDLQPEILKMRLSQIAKETQFAKSVNTAAASGTAGYATIPLAYDPRIVDITRYYTPIIGMIKKVTNKGLNANYYRLTNRSRVDLWGRESGALNEQDDTRELDSEKIKFCRVVGKVTGVARSASAHFVDSMREEIMAKTVTMNEEMEDTIINGDNSTNPLEPDGLIQMLSHNDVDISSDTVTLTDVKTLVADCYMDKGHPNLIITDPYTAQSLENQMMDFIRYTNPYKSIAWGLQALTINTIVGPIPIVPSQFMPIATNNKRLLCVDTNMLEQRILLDTSFERLGKVEDAEKFYLKTYRTFINKFPEGMGQLHGIA